MPGTRFDLIPFLEVEILVGAGEGRWCIPPIPYFPYSMYNACSQAVCPVMMLSWPVALLKVIFILHVLHIQFLSVSFEILRFQECT